MKRTFEAAFPIWDKMNKSQQDLLMTSCTAKKIAPGVMVHSGKECLGLLLIKSGQLRAYMMSETGKEVTLFRMFQDDVCLFTASCVINSLDFDILIESETETEFWIVPPEVYRKVMEESLPLATFINDLMAARFSDIMWLMEQIVFKSMDERLCAFLLDESTLLDSHILTVTHEKIANHLGSAREVITRLLKYLQDEGLVLLNRGSIEIKNRPALEDRANKL